MATNFSTLTPITKLLLPKKNTLEIPISRHIPILYSVPYGALNIGVLLFNGLCIFVFARRPSLRVRNSNLLLISLATSDFLVGISSLYYLLNLVTTLLDDYTRKLSTLILGFSLETSMLCLTCLTYERLVAIWRPLEYKAIFTRCRVYAAVILTWVFSALTFVMRVLLAFIFSDKRYFVVNRLIFVIMPSVVAFFLLAVYGYLFCEIHRHSKNIKKQVPRPSTVTQENLETRQKFKDECDESSKVDETSDSLVGKANAISPRHISREKRSLLLCCAVVVAFVLCWLPIVVFLCGKLLEDEYISNDYMLYLSTFLISLNSFFNPCLYFAIRKDFRSAAASTWKCRV